MSHTKSILIGNSQLSKTGYESCLLYYMVTSIEQKVFSFKHDLNIGQSIHRLYITNLSPATMNEGKFMLQALLTHIRLTKRCVICRLVLIISD